MTLSIELANLRSRAIRAAAVPGGVRRFAVGALTTRIEGDLVTKVWDGFGRSVGFILGSTLRLLFQGAVFSVTLLVQITVSVFQFIWNFNWNADFGDAKQRLVSDFNSWAGTLGGTVGNALGHLVCGGGIGSLIMVFNEPLALYIFKELGEEALQDIAANLANLIKQTAGILARSAFTFLYASARSLLFGGFQNALKVAGLVTQEQIDSTAKAKKEPWSFSIGTQNFIKSVPIEAVRNLLENGIEEFSDACIEDGYIIASSIDSYLAAAKTANNGILGTEQTIEILLNRTPQPTV